MVEDNIKDISIVLCGAAGQGIQTVESLLTKSLKRSGYNVFASREYMSRVRGGVNSTSIRVSSRPVRAYLERIDILIPLNQEAIPHVKDRISSQTIIIGEAKFLGSSSTTKGINIEVPFTEFAQEIGNKILANIISLGVICGILNAEKSILQEAIVKNFEKKGQTIIDENINAVNKGYEISTELIDNNKLQRTINIEKTSEVKDQYIVDGRQAVALGAIAGGANFVTFYPMAPSTGVGTFLAQHGLEFSIIVDQSEDELSVINKAIGASYAGARAFVSTSGGGFSLMCEGISCLGMMELPLVVLVGSRPGPATGMPTRTAQEDLELVLYAGAGYFPRMIFAPGTIEDAFELTQNAFNLTQEYQLPVFILTDQYLIDSYYNTSTLNHENLEIKKFFVKTDKNYQRYRFTESGISPFGIPGYGDGLVDADSHTHTEEGDITEDPDIRAKTVEKRYKKLELIKKITIPPEFIGREGYKTLIIAWGSNYYIIKEAIENLNRNDVALLYFKQVYPIHSSVKNYIEKAEQTIIIENNPNAQLAKLIELESHRAIDFKILRYTGYAFSVEELLDSIKNILEGK
ncbi:MAG: 2-oxoacid:acceptor oxidoreductase subunit alpha [Promethearchaeota archaeon]